MYRSYNNNRYSYSNHNNSNTNPQFKRYGYHRKYTKDDYVSGLMYLACGTLLFILFMYVLKQIFADQASKPAILEEFFEKPTEPTKKEKTQSKGEALCKKLAEDTFGVPFEKIRPDMLKNKVTGYNLELDIYNDALKVAIEYNGEQHYKYIPFFHKNYEAFLNQKYRDEIKRMLCEKNGIHLIEIRFDTAPTDIATIIKLEAIKLGHKKADL